MENSDKPSTSTEHLETLLESGKVSQAEYETLRDAMDASPSPVAKPPSAAGAKRFGKSWTNRQLGGVCGGIAEATGIGAWRIRECFILAALLSGGGALLVYLLLYFTIPWNEEKRSKMTRPRFDLWRAC